MPDHIQSRKQAAKLVQALGMIQLLPVVALIAISAIYVRRIPSSLLTVIVLSVLSANGMVLLVSGLGLRTRLTSRLKRFALAGLSVFILCMAAGAGSVVYDLIKNGPDIKAEPLQYGAILLGSLFIVAGAIGVVRVARLT